MHDDRMTISLGIAMQTETSEKPTVFCAGLPSVSYFTVFLLSTKITSRFHVNAALVVKFYDSESIHSKTVEGAV